MAQLGIDEARMAFKPSSSLGLNRIVKAVMWKNVSGHRRFVYITEVRQRVRGIVGVTSPITLPDPRKAKEKRTLVISPAYNS